MNYIIGNPLNTVKISQVIVNPISYSGYMWKDFQDKFKDNSNVCKKFLTNEKPLPGEIVHCHIPKLGNSNSEVRLIFNVFTQVTKNSPIRKKWVELGFENLKQYLELFSTETELDIKFVTILPFSGKGLSWSSVKKIYEQKLLPTEKIDFLLFLPENAKQHEKNNATRLDYFQLQKLSSGTTRIPFPDIRQGFRSRKVSIEDS